MELVYLGLMGLLSLISFIIFIMILIKSFKEGGVLHGVIGLITCGLYTFVWGWLKHKELQITKIMLLWSILIVGSIGLQFVIGTSQVMQLMTMGSTSEIKSKKSKTDRSKISKRKRPARRSTDKAAVAKNRAAKRKKVAAEKKQPQSAMEWHDQAVALWKNGKYSNPSKAINYLGRSIQMDPNLADAYNNRGNAYRELKQYPNALQDYNKAIQLNPNFAKAYNNRGNIYFDQKNYQQAITNYNKSIALNPNYSIGYLNRGLAYHHQKKTAQACQDFKKACELGDCDGSKWAKQNGICK